MVGAAYGGGHQRGGHRGYRGRAVRPKSSAAGEAIVYRVLHRLPRLARGDRGACRRGQHRGGAVQVLGYATGRVLGLRPLADLTLATSENTPSRHFGAYGLVSWSTGGSRRSRWPRTSPSGASERRRT